jgi:hypothetical protein|nr:MAG TPA: hypothetical protein [Caudoviricetes sp.]
MENENEETKDTMSVEAPEAGEAAAGSETESPPAPPVPADYVFEPVEGIDGKTAEGFDADFIRYAKEAGLDREAAARMRNGMLTAFNQQTKARAEAVKEYDAKCAGEIREMFGKEYPARMEAISGLIEKIDGVPNGECRRFLEGTKLMNEPVFVRFMDVITRIMPDEAAFFSANSPEQSADDIKTEIARMMKEAAYSDGGHPEHAAMVQKVYALRQKLSGAA